MDSDEHTTEELGSLVSHGIEDHYPKFWDNPLSYFIYMHLLFYAKQSGPEKGRYIFETREISNLMCFGRKATDKEPSMHRGTITKAIKHLEKIGMIKSKMFRPFPRKAIAAAIGSAKKIAVLDRNHSPGSGGVFWQEILVSLREKPNVIVQDYLVGLGGGDVTPKIIHEIVDDLAGRSEAVEPLWKEVAA